MTCRLLLPGIALLAAPVMAGPPPVSYRIAARLIEPAGQLVAAESIVYRNLAPDTLRSLWFHLYPGAFAGRGTAYGRELERSGRYDFGLARARDRGSISLHRIEAQGAPLVPVLEATEMELPLANALAPGDTVAVVIDFSVNIPAPFAELGRKGRSYVIAHWYPQVAVYDKQDWHADGYHLFGHSPGEFADYDVSVAVASDMAVAATGRLLSPGDEDDWLRWPPGSRRPSPGTTKTLTFTAENVPDFALAAGPGFVLLRDSAAGVRVNILARYPVGLDWLNAFGYVSDILESYTQWYGPFPFEQLTIVQADGLCATDASYPGLVILSQRPIPATRLFEQALARQIALQWFSCAVGPDELRCPWVAKGPAARAEMRYLEAKYGRTNLVDNLVLNWLFAGLSAEYYHQFYNYVASSNRLLEPLVTPATDYRDRFSFDATSISHAGLLFRNVERRTGTATYDALLRDYVRRYRGLHPDEMTLVGLLKASPVFDAAPALWRSRSARKVTVHPIFALPGFDTYQLFYGPYAWADNYHGLQLEAWLQGRQFVDAGPLHGRHMWTLSETYSTKIDDWHTGFSYQTPLEFISNRLRFSLGLDYSLIEAGAKANLVHEFGPVFGQPKLTIDLGYRYLDLHNLRFRDRRAWDLAAFSDVRLKLAHTYEVRNFKGSQRLYLARGLTELGGDSDYWKASIEETHTFRWSVNSGITLRAFAGSAWGGAPSQEQFYLSGGLIATTGEPVSWGYQGWTSGQEHWHYDADVNCRGFAGGYEHGRYAWGLNLYYTPVKSIQPFFDVGNVGEGLGDSLWQPRMDAGVRLRLGPLYADFPFWRYSVVDGKHEFAFRWMLGLKLSEVTSGQ
jgi:hypothetical protein